MVGGGGEGGGPPLHPGQPSHYSESLLFKNQRLNIGTGPSVGDYLVAEACVTLMLEQI